MTYKQTNILRVYHLASGDEIASGLQWYKAASQEAYRIALANHRTLEQACGVIAALSPGLRWELNIEAAERMIKGESLEGLGIRWKHGPNKARLILAGHKPYRVLNGAKTRAFADCIANPDTTLSVVVDGHAYAIWCGRRVPLDETPPINDRLYAAICADYWSVSKHVGIRACQLQAVTWCTWRRLHGINRRHNEV